MAQALKTAIVMGLIALGVELVLLNLINRPDPTMAEVSHKLCVDSTGNAGCDATNNTSSDRLVSQSERRAQEQR